MTHWSHLEQRESDQKVLRGFRTKWSHLEPKIHYQQVFRGVRTHWSHLEHSDQEVFREDLLVVPWIRGVVR